MNDNLSTSGTSTQTIVFAILNWGLGHASRSVPLIKEFQKRGYRIVVCTDGQVVDFLETELENIIYEYLPSYDIHYKYGSMAKNMIVQFPKIINTYFKEHRVFQEIAQKHQADLCISDNRFGCRSSSIPSLFMTHQWNILGTNGKKHLLASKVNQFIIRKFDGLIIPDNKNNSLSGKLSDGCTNIKVFYTGILSRFINNIVDKSENNLKEISTTAILSGPEPARTKLETQIIDRFSLRHDQNFIIIRGTCSKLRRRNEIPSHIQVFDILNRHELQRIISRSETIICRSGYSSLMDYLSIGVNSLTLIPTQGQTEQEYLARRVSEMDGIQLVSKEKGALGTEYHLNIVNTNKINTNNLQGVIEKILKVI